MLKTIQAKIFPDDGGTYIVRTTGKKGSRCGKWTNRITGRTIQAHKGCNKGLECNEKNRCVDKVSLPLTTSTNAQKIAREKYMQNMQNMHKRAQEKEPIGFYNSIRPHKTSSQDLYETTPVVKSGTGPEEIYHEQPKQPKEPVYTDMSRLTSENTPVQPVRPPSSSKPKLNNLKQTSEEEYYVDPTKLESNKLKKLVQSQINSQMYNEARNRIPSNAKFKPQPRTRTKTRASRNTQRKPKARPRPRPRPTPRNTSTPRPRPRTISRKVSRSISRKGSRKLHKPPKKIFSPIKPKSRDGFIFVKDKNFGPLFKSNGEKIIYKWIPRPEVPKKSQQTKIKTKLLAEANKAKASASGKRKRKQRKKSKKKKLSVREGLIVKS